ncbi:trypsin-like peptidase domain-containing protein [Cognatishimia sp.]|uniref:trypsin-like peptidase domain-containing protein n=1 Tax=Cognatishimia sp. TaxID=2211648 RepID=UPI003518021A
MRFKFLSFVIALLLGAQFAMAQSNEGVWVQIKARPSLTEATVEAQEFAQSLENVNGFALGGGWYAIALGPFDRATADRTLRDLRRRNLIPRDSYITFSSAFESQFWPLGNAVVATTTPTVTETTEDTSEPEQVAVVPEVVEPQEPEFRDPGETVAEARASENQLNREQKKDLQRLLQWAGFYNSAIDGAYGRGTRRAMAAWQEDNGYEATGIMSTLQRAEILTAYNAILDGMDMRLVTEFDSGIEIQIPTGVVTKSNPIYPFVTFKPKGDIDAQVILISQDGSRTTLAGLYEIMQTLTIVPLDGPRKLNRNGFMLEGTDDNIVSYTEVGLRDGQIKGFTLVWPTGDEERRRRILGEMQASFTRIGGTLAPDAGLELLDDIDLLSGLEVRRPKFSRTGFFTDGSGTVVTTTEAVGECQRVTVNQDYEADVVGQEDALGIAVLRPKDSIAPISVATFRSSSLPRTSEVAVAGYSFEGLLGAPTLTYGTVQDLRGLGGELDQTRLSLAPQPGDAGGPVFDISGNVVGMLMAREANARQLPNDVSLTADSEAIQALLAASGLNAASGDQIGALDPVDLTEYAGEMTVLVSCW